MFTVSSEAEVALSREQVWNLLSDISLPHNYVPGVLSTEIVTEKSQGVGASRLVHQKNNRAMGETVEQWTEGYGFVIRIHHRDGGAQPPFKEATFEYRIEEREGRTFLVNSMSYELVGGAVGRFLNSMLLSRITRSTLHQVTENQAAFYETCCELKSG